MTKHELHEFVLDLLRGELAALQSAHMIPPLARRLHRTNAWAMVRRRANRARPSPPRCATTPSAAPAPLRAAPPPDLVEKEADSNPLSVGLGALCIKCAS